MKTNSGLVKKNDESVFDASSEDELLGEQKPVVSSGGALLSLHRGMCTRESVWSSQRNARVRHMHVRHSDHTRESRVSGQVFCGDQNHEMKKTSSHDAVPCECQFCSVDALCCVQVTFPDDWPAAASVGFRSDHLRSVVGALRHGQKLKLTGKLLLPAVLRGSRMWCDLVRRCWKMGGGERQRLRCKYCVCRVERRTNRSNTRRQQRDAWRETQ